MKKIITLLALVFCLNTNAQYTQLHGFASNIDGANPQGSLITDGTFLYGMTNVGGKNNYGTIFKVKFDGTGFDTLLTFNGNNGNQAGGGYPNGTLYYDGTYLYGMTSLGGLNNTGIIFKIKPNGTGYDTLHNFGSGDGANPYGSLISDGTYLYGMTSEGGYSNDHGTIFKILPNGSGYVSLYWFGQGGNGDGSNPYGSLYYDGSFLYGMTSTTMTGGGGQIFKIMPNGTNYTVLHQFTGLANNNGDGNTPYGSLISDGTFLYGMTEIGGLNSSGSIFKIMPNGTGYDTLLSLKSITGRNPYSDLTYAGGVLYGMTNLGGTHGLGTIFKLMPNGTGYDTLLNFNSLNGYYPFGSLLSIGGCLYGMTSGGGSNGYGNVFDYCLNSTGINQLSEKNAQVNIYPNPNKGSFVVETDGTTKQTMQIYDVTGKMVLSQIIQPTPNPSKEGNVITVDVVNLNDGVYNVSLQSNEGTINKRLVIVR